MAAPVVVAGSPATGTNAPHSASSTDVHEPELPSVLRKVRAILPACSLMYLTLRKRAGSLARAQGTAPGLKPAHLHTDLVSTCCSAHDHRRFCDLFPSACVGTARCLRRRCPWSIHLSDTVNLIQSTCIRTLAAIDVACTMPQLVRTCLPLHSVWTLSSARCERDHITHQKHALQMEKWGSKLAVGEPVWPTRFVPMKTPLSSHLLAAHFAPGECAQPLTLPSALSHCARRGLRVGLVINLAAHHCLYAEEVPRDVPMEHVRMTAKILPPIAAVRQVIRAADAFWEAHPEQYIAIHCDYGAPGTLTPLRT